MHKIQYLELALKQNMPRNLNWAYSVYAITKATTERPEPNESTYGRVFKRDWGFETVVKGVDDTAPYVYEKIEDASKDEALFSFKDRVVAQPGWLLNIKEPVETFVGTLHLNCLCIVGPFKDKINYVNSSPFSINKIEQYVCERLHDTPEPGAPRDPKLFYCDELVAFNNTISLVEELSPLSIISSTPKLICPPTGGIEYRNTLVKEYGDRLTDPVVFAEFEGKLKKHDAEYLKDDPTYGKFASGKVLNIARKKMFLTGGIEMGFSDSKKADPVITSLYEEYPKDSKKLAMVFNGQRAGSYSRGAETVDGGVTEKVTNRAIADYSIKEGDCGAKLGKSNYYYEHDYKQLSGKYVIDNSGKKTFVENIEDAKNYLGKLVTVRSPQYCTTKGEQICDVCAGIKFAKFKFSLSIPAQEISATVLLSKLKKMHGTVLSTTTIEHHHFS